MLEKEQTLIHQAWEQRSHLNATDTTIKQAVESVIQALDQGTIRIAEKIGDQWSVNQWAKKAVLLAFRLWGNQCFESFPYAFDKVPLKFDGWTEPMFQSSKIRVVPGSIVRYGAYVGKDTILMPSFVNIGAYVGEGTMVDTWATIGSCAQVGKRCHISGGVGLGGVLEPLQAEPVIIEDDCFIGARSEIVEGVRVEQGAVIGMGVFIGASTPIVHRYTGEITYGVVPSYSVVIAGSMPGKEVDPLKKGASPSLNCAVIIKQVDEKTRSKTGINDLLRP